MRNTPPSLTVMVTLLVVTITPSPAAAQTAADSTAIVQAALDYIEGWYEGDPERMARALHPELVKRISHHDPSTDLSFLSQMGATQLVEGTARGGGRDTPGRQKDVTVLDIFRNAASAKIVASNWVDYLHLSKVDGRWVIVNVLWELKERPAG